MATVDVNRNHIKLNDGGVACTPVAMTASNEYYLDLKGSDYKTVFVFSNANSTSAKVTIAIGDGIQGVGENIEFNVEQNKVVPVVVDSGAYKIVAGEHKGFAKVTVTSGCNVAVVELP